MEDVVFDTSWEDIVCPICLDFPHNSVLLQCSSYDKGCRPFVCDTNQLHSNCLDRFKTACGMPSSCDATYPMSNATSPVSDATSVDSNEAVVSDCEGKLSCPLCRGDVSGWIIVDKARVHFDDKKRCCDEHQCKFMGSYSELQKHAHLEHPHAHPSKIDPARKLDWENFQQSSEVIDVLSTIQSEIPRGVVLGDYVIEYGDGDTGDDFEDFPGDEGNWWTSCILYQAFSNFRSSRNRRRIRIGDASRVNRHSSYDTSNSDEGSVASVEYAEYRLDETGDDFVSTISSSRGSSGFRRVRSSCIFSFRFHRSQRRRSRFFDS